MRYRAYAAIAAVLLLALTSRAAWSQTFNVRALLVGNSYDKQPGLEVSNTLGDVRNLRDVLAGSPKIEARNVHTLENGTRAQIYEAWTKLLSEIAGPTVAVFYYAGHGVEIDGKNFLIPIGTPYPPEGSERQMEDGLVSLNGLLTAFQKAKLEAKKEDEDIVGIFILNACRSTALIEEERPGIRTGFGPPRIPPASDIFVLYAAGTGRPAIAGRASDGRTLFAKHLLPILEQQATRPLADIAQALRFLVSEDAKSRYNETQIPSYYDQLNERRNLFGSAQDVPSGMDLINSLPVLPKVSAPVKALQRTEGPLPLDCENCPALVALKAGTVRTGTTPIDVSAFAIGKYEVTNTEWNTCVRAGECTGSRGIPLFGGRYRGEAPVADVTWDDAQSYLRWLRSVTGYRYRLPSELEWDYAAATAPIEAKKMCEFANAADRSMKPSAVSQFPCVDGYARGPAPVGSFRANNNGLHDMLGNVWEWTEDCWTITPYRGNIRAATCERVAKGGSWRSGLDQLKPGVRVNLPQDHSRSSVGFRVARDLAPPP